MNVPIFIGLAEALLALLPTAALVYGLSAVLLPAEAPHARYAGSVVLGYGLQGLAFYTLLYSGQFTPLAGAAATSLAAIGLFGLYVRAPSPLLEALDHDLDALAELGSALSTSGVRWVIGATGLLFGAQGLRALCAPPMAWDDLTYHLVKPTLWVQHAGPATYDAPGAWEYYRFFLPLGESLPAWGLLYVGSDLAIPLIGAGIWILLVGTIYALARELGASRSHATLGALGAALIPAVATHMFTAYVDNHTALLQIAAFVLLAHQRRDTTLRSGTLAILGLAVAVAIKQTALPSCMLGAGLFLYYRRDRFQDSGLVPFGAAAVGTLLMTVPPLVFNYAETGSPTYPFALELQGAVWFHGSEEFQWLNDEVAALRSRLGYLTQTFWGGYHGHPLLHRNFGPASALVLIGSLTVVPETLGDDEKGWFPALLAVWGVVLVGLLVVLFSGTGWNQARYFATGPILCASVLATRDWQGVTAVLVAFWAVNMVFFLPFNWSMPDAGATGLLAALSLPFIGVGWMLVRRIPSCSVTRRTRAAGYLATGLVGFLVVAATCVAPIRHAFRYTIYRQAGQQNSFLNIPVGGNHGLGMASADLWERVDRPGRSLRIAVTAGWDGKGHNWFVYPFFGRYLQNEITYVSITESGERLSRRHGAEARQRADLDRWLQRLQRRNVDYVAALAPKTIEARWMEHHEAFERVATGGRPSNVLYRLRAREGSN